MDLIELRGIANKLKKILSLVDKLDTLVLRIEETRKFLGGDFKEPMSLRELNVEKMLREAIEELEEE